jgi:hypothetical protein
MDAGLRLTEVVRVVEGLRYQAVAQAVKRFGAALGQDAACRKFVLQLRRHLSLIYLGATRLPLSRVNCRERHRLLCDSNV